jgi:hypothetical protein
VRCEDSVDVDVLVAVIRMVVVMLIPYGHRVLQLAGMAGVRAEAADVGARSSGAGAGASAPP